MKLIEGFIDLTRSPEGFVVGQCPNRLQYGIPPCRRRVRGLHFSVKDGTGFGYKKRRGTALDSSSHALGNPMGRYEAGKL